MNGTQLNGADIATGESVLHPGDRINIGAWTALTVDPSQSPGTR